MKEGARLPLATGECVCVVGGVHFVTIMYKCSHLAHDGRREGRWAMVLLHVVKVRGWKPFKGTSGIHKSSFPWVTTELGDFRMTFCSKNLIKAFILLLKQYVFREFSDPLKVAYTPLFSLPCHLSQQLKNSLA